MIPATLLGGTAGRAPGICVYGPAGVKKTHAIATLPPPVYMADFEGGSASIMPWIERSRRSSDAQWTVHTQAQREAALASLNEEVRATVAIKPNPYVSVVYYDNMTVAAYDAFIIELGNFDLRRYSSYALDSLQEFAITTQTYSKGAGNEASLMNDVSFAWIRAQERAMIQLRRLKNLRDEGVLVYLTASEDIAKDYVKNPLEKGAGGAEPYSIRGTVNLPGKLAEGLAHLPDILVHARLMNGQITWVTKPEMLPGGGAHWDAKDRYGRLPAYVDPSVRVMLDCIYGREVRVAIYGKRTPASADATDAA